MAVRISEQSKKDLDRYTRNFVMKSLQVIVQSRMGEKFNYSAKENAVLEWFSLPIPDLQELTAVARKTLGAGPVLSEPVNVEISLKTKDNAYMFLEVWSLWLDTDHCDPNVKISSTVYGRMTLALKSILSVSRVAPCFRLAQRQKKDDFQIHYQYTVGPPNLSLLGAEMATQKIAGVSTPVGTIRTSLSYSTDLSLPQTGARRAGVTAPLDVKHDHFSSLSPAHAPLNNKCSQPKPCNRKFRNPTSVEDLRLLDALEKQDTFNAMFSTSPPEGVSPPLPHISEIMGAHRHDHASYDSSPEESNPFHPVNRSVVFVSGASPPGPTMERAQDTPFASLMAGLAAPRSQSSDDSTATDEGDGGEEEGEEEEEEGSEEEGEEEEASGTQSPGSLDFVMLPPLEFPFAESDPTSLGQFYRTMSQAPQLSMCQDETVTLGDYLDTVRDQLDTFSAGQAHCQRLLRSVCGEDTQEASD